MKQVSKFLAAAMAMLFVSAASAGTLYWQVDDNSGNVTAQLYAQQGDNEAGRIALSDELDAPTGVRQADIGLYSDGTYLFYVEMLNYSEGTITQGYKWGYDDLVSSGYVSFGATDIPTVSANAAGFAAGPAAIPEPSSGLLLLMGGAILALRRRRQK